MLLINPFSANVPIMDKPGSWFLLAKCLKNTCGRPQVLFKTPKVFFKHFARKTIWFLHKWNVGRKWVKIYLAKKTCYLVLT